jgi:hypothetical protein
MSDIEELKHCSVEEVIHIANWMQPSQQAKLIK